MANWLPIERKFQKVPLFLRNVKHNSDAYDPKVVSFGPYHHGRPELQLCQNAKSLTLRIFVDGSGHDLDFFKEKVSSMMEYARSCYVEGSTDKYTEDEFGEMMLLDACFLICFMRMVVDENYRYAHQIHNHLGRLVFFTVMRDMILLENQLPFRVVMLLISLRYDRKLVEEAVIRYLHMSIWGPQEICEEILQQQIHNIYHAEHPPLHILEAYRRVLVWDLTPPASHAVTITDGDDDLRPYYKTFRSATDLKAKGIHFKSSEVRSLESINFSSGYLYGQLELPVCFVTAVTKVFFLNMIAYEICPDNFLTVKSTVISYLAFMKSLVEKPSDVKELREKKILVTRFVSDEDVVQLYRDLDTFEMEDDKFSLMKEKRKIQEHYDSKGKTWIAELIHVYLSSPWSILGWIVGLLLLILTFLQTYFTIAN